MSRSPSTESLDAEECHALLAATRTVLTAMLRPAEASRLLRTLAEEAARLLDTDSAAVCTLEPEGDVLRVRIGLGLLASSEGELLPLEVGFVGEAVSSGHVRQTTDLSAESKSFRSGAQGAEIGPALVLPLRVEDHIVGTVLAVRGAGNEPFADEQLRMGEEFAWIAATAVENVRAFDEARGARAGIEALRREVELEAWRTRYDMLAEADRKVAFEWNLATDAVAWGGSARAVFGYETADFGATLDEWSARLHEEDRERVLEGMRGAAEQGAPFRLEGRLRNAGGTYSEVVIRGGSPGRGRAADRVVGAIDDMSARAQGSPKERQARLDAAQEIVRGLRHEINNPLAVVMGQAQLLQNEPAVSGDPLLRQSITAIFEESTRLEELMKRLENLEHKPREPFLNDIGGLNLPTNGS